MTDFKQIVRFDNGRSSDDGRLIQFEAHARDSSVVGLEIAVKDIGDFIAFLAGLAQHADRKKPMSNWRLSFRTARM